MEKIEELDINQHIWGFTPEGEAIVIYTMTNKQGANIRLTNFGASIVAINVPDREGVFADVALGYSRWQDYQRNSSAMGRSIGRYANRIANGRFQLDGKEYHLPLNAPPHHLNGGANGFHNRLWEGRVETNRVVFAYQSVDGEEGYPGELSVEVCYDWDDNCNLEITYFAKGDSTTIVNLTNKLYLNLKGEGRGTILDHHLQINADRFLPTDSTQIVTGELRKVEGTPMDFRHERPIGEAMNLVDKEIQQSGGYDHCWVTNGFKNGENLLLAAQLYEPTSGRTVTVTTTQPGLQLNTGNWLQGLPTGKSGMEYLKHSGVVLGCQAFPDTPNHPEFPTVRLESGEIYEQHIIYSFGIRR